MLGVTRLPSPPMSPPPIPPPHRGTSSSTSGLLNANFSLVGSHASRSNFNPETPVSSGWAPDYVNYSHGLFRFYYILFLFLYCIRFVEYCILFSFPYTRSCFILMAYSS
ncbi:hypothetical protein BDZ91DRAFT_742297 [Kalaharituber pfeilii]|nr:hypothetical protein BDZ91DRAFT_742297 [Kalaharituber pfeilii]